MPRIANSLPHLPPRFLLLALLCLLPFAAACTPAAQGAEGPAEQTLSMRQFRFQPEELRLPAGEQVQLTLDNLELLPHSLDIDALGIHVPLEGQEQKTITVPALPPGEYELYCGVPGHREAGMVSTLVIE